MVKPARTLLAVWSVKLADKLADLNKDDGPDRSVE
jgi:hypothetical protein